MTAIILHLSDIHIKTVKDPILHRGAAIASTLFSSLPSASHVFIVISGDVAFSGIASEYESARELFTTIQETIQQEKNCPVSFILAPGNHDCDFTKDDSTRKMLLENIARSETHEIDDSVITNCVKIQNDFFEFRNSLENTLDVKDDLLWRTNRFEVEGKKLEFDCLNVSWGSKIKDEPGLLYFPFERYPEETLELADIRFVVLHHPLNWFRQTNYRPFRTFVRQIANIVISGHEHQGTVGSITDAETDTSAFIEGWVLQGDSRDLTDSSFNLVLFDLAANKFASTRYKWDGTRYAASEKGSWSDYHDLPEKRTNDFSLEQEFQNTLDDPGAFFKHPGGINIGLSDIYVFPDLQKVINIKDRRTFVSSSTLLSPEVTAEGILIEGAEQSGRTCLLYQLFRQYHERGFVPLLIKGKDLKKAADHQIENRINHAVEQQYGEGQKEAFGQLSRTKKLLLLDNLDDSPIKAPRARADLLCALRDRFGHLVITVGDMFEMREMFDGNTSRSLSALTHYKLQPFGHRLRGVLINRWLSLGADETVDEATRIARLDQAEKLINTVMQKAVIPAIPIYLLTLLQSMDAGRSGDFKESQLGYYYQYLLTDAFQNSGVKPNILTEVFQYSTYLAWEFHIQGGRELSEAELETFNTQFSKRWHTVEFKPRLDVLQKARVLRKVGENYAFRYPYIYYYLKGQYLSENLANTEVSAYIKHCCRHLYVRDYANTVLFLAHHTNDDFVLQSVAEALHNLFKECPPVKFKSDTALIAQLIEEAPTLVYTGEEPTDHRSRRNTLEDKLDDGNDGLAEEEETAEELSLIAQLTMLFKTTEILGQVLKNQYSKIERIRKKVLIEDLFNGPLRALRNFYQYFEKNPKALVIEIDAALQRKGNIQTEEERKLIARKSVAQIIKIVTFAFLMRASQSANSESLLEDVESVVQGSNSLAFKIIEMGIHLDSPKLIQRKKLKHLFTEFEKEFVARSAIEMMVINRLYMFKTTESDMQWLSAELNINLTVQHAITYQEKQRRVT